MNNTAIARLALEGGLGIGTITGGAYAAQYSSELRAHPDKVDAFKHRLQIWVQYAVSCMNSINRKGGGQGHSGGTKEAATQEAMDCKGHISAKLGDQLAIKWTDHEPGKTEAGTNPK